MEALESHYFHIPYPGALGAPEGVWAARRWERLRARSGNLRPRASAAGGDEAPGCIARPGLGGYHG